MARAQPGQLWILAMLAPKPGLRVAAVPPHAANSAGPARDVGGLTGRDGGAGALIEPRNMDQPESTSAPSRPFTQYCFLPDPGETENASHTES